jgi:CheY-like chemotaxis protein
MKQLSVLVVEDLEPMRDILEAILINFGFGRIYKAREGEEAFAKFQKYKPDIVITDWHMDGVDGLELTRWIRRSKYSVNRSVPIILTTGFSEKFRIASARDTGITEVLLKPFSAEDLAKRIMYVIDKPRDFIEAQEFFGPDRRRRPDDEFGDEDRRKINPVIVE